MRINNPHIKLITIAVDRVKKITGITNVIAKRNFDKKVATVATHI